MCAAACTAVCGCKITHYLPTRQLLSPVFWLSAWFWACSRAWLWCRQQKSSNTPCGDIAAFCRRCRRVRGGDYLPWCSSETVNFLRPWARREANTRRPFFVAILSRKPCLFTLLLLWGWNVLFIFLYYLFIVIVHTLGCKITQFFSNNQKIDFIWDKYLVFFPKQAQ